MSRGYSTGNGSAETASSTGLRIGKKTGFALQSSKPDGLPIARALGSLKAAKVVSPTRDAKSHRLTVRSM